MTANVAAIAAVLGGREVIGSDVTSLGDLERIVTEGLPKQSIRSLARSVYPDADRQRHLIYRIIPEATFKRRGARLNQTESERTERLARLVASAKRVWEDDEDAQEFLITPHPLLEGRTPIEAARSEIGAQRVEEILSSIEWGLPV